MVSKFVSFLALNCILFTKDMWYFNICGFFYSSNIGCKWNWVFVCFLEIMCRKHFWGTPNILLAMKYREGHLNCISKMSLCWSVWKCNNDSFWKWQVLSTVSKLVFLSLFPCKRRRQYIHLWQEMVETSRDFIFHLRYPILST